MELSNILDIQQAALITNMAITSIHYHIKQGHLKASRIGHAWLIDNHDLITFITARNSGKYCKAGRPKRSPVMKTTTNAPDQVMEIGKKELTLEA